LGERASHAASRGLAVISLAVAGTGFGMWFAWAIFRAVTG